MLKQKAQHSICSSTVIKSDPLLTKLIICLGEEEGARLSRHPEYPCTHTRGAAAINTELLVLPKGSDSAATLVQPESYHCLNHICFSGNGKIKTNGTQDGYKLHLT